MAQARGELKRMRTDLNKFKSEERYRMKSVEGIVKTGQITIEQVDQIKSGTFAPPDAKKAKISVDVEQIAEKVKLSNLIARPIGKIKSPYLTKSGTPRQPGLVDTSSTIELFQGETGKEVVQRWMPKGPVHSKYIFFINRAFVLRTLFLFRDTRLDRKPRSRP